jgi:hypothetical protein
MAQSPNRPSGAKAGGGRRRTPPPQVKKPFPWGIVGVSVVLGLFLIGILVYAVTNEGAGFKTALSISDSQVDGVKVYKVPSAKHVTTTVEYPQSPPVGGPHNAIPQTCEVYTAPIANEHAVHSMEHGAVWITYKPDLPAGEVAKLAQLVTGTQYRLLSPYPDLKTPISLQAWGRQVTANSPDDKQVREFLDAYTGGAQAPERGAACSGTTATGPLQAQPEPSPGPSTAPTVAPSPATSAAPSPAPSRS